MDNNKPIGIFDSGVGGLTVLKEILKVLPNESLIYLGDTARVPYGTHGKEVITKFALEMTQFLLKHKVKFLVVSCNTISATCLHKIEAFSPVPVLGVIDSAVKQALQTTKTQHIGVIGTRATISSGVYEKKLKKINPKVKVVTQSCSLFVPLIEEDLISHQATQHIAEDYLSKFSSANIDTLILGCTHYPLLSDSIKKVVGKNVTLVDSAQPTANELKKILEEKGLLNQQGSPTYEFYITDAPERATKVAQKFFGKLLPGKLIKISL
ncbi:MAG: glutamate racemase [Candidatus Daviesbacteria bacterium]